MSLPDAKALKKLADACRKAGIKSFKSAEFEITLSDEAPVSNYKRQKAAKSDVAMGAVMDEFKSEAVSEDQLLFWSAADLQNEDGAVEA